MPFGLPEKVRMPIAAAPGDATPAEKEKAQKSAAGAVGETLGAFHKFFLQGKTFVGGDHVSIADIRLACSLEFLKVIDYHLPESAKTYTGAVAKKTSRATSPQGAEEVGCGRRAAALSATE
jgi:glutathione S-transferase